ncbi:betaine--homocysteine S-methyltransferase 1-like isoform X2 [Tachypleus tridentatus]|uniref:betaine--homocysteine S-methyltransferase 1-like isoform X1 n=1 Tax=Tachypleus tridentatus TaxID=6853 RepID=UPI003FD4DB67
MEFAKDNKKGLLQRLDEGVVVGDGGFLIALEKRGYVKAGPWTPEACVENPEAVRQLHREFLRAGSDVMQAFTFYASESNLKYRGNEAGENFSEDEINNEACKLAREVSEEGDCLVAGGFAQHPNYQPGTNKKKVQEDFRKQVDVFVENGVDFLICEYFENIEEIIWAIEVCKETKLPVAANMCIGPEGDVNHISCGECAVKMVKAGADVVGVNCRFDPFVSLEAVRLMKKALEAEGLKAHLMFQPLAFFTPDAGKLGLFHLPEFPFEISEAEMENSELEDAGTVVVDGRADMDDLTSRVSGEVNISADEDTMPNTPITTQTDTVAHDCNLGSRSPVSTQPEVTFTLTRRRVRFHPHVVAHKSKNDIIKININSDEKCSMLEDVNNMLSYLPSCYYILINLR